MEPSLRSVNIFVTDMKCVKSWQRTKSDHAKSIQNCNVFYSLLLTAFNMKLIRFRAALAKGSCLVGEIISLSVALTYRAAEDLQSALFLKNLLWWFSLVAKSGLIQCDRNFRQHFSKKKNRNWMNQCFRQLLLMQTESDILFSVLKREPKKCRSNIAGNMANSEAGKIYYSSKSP